MTKIAVLICVCAVDWVAESAIKASNGVKMLTSCLRGCCVNMENGYRSHSLHKLHLCKLSMAIQFYNLRQTQMLTLV